MDEIRAIQNRIMAMVAKGPITKTNVEDDPVLSNYEHNTIMVVLTQLSHCGQLIRMNTDPVIWKKA